MRVAVDRDLCESNGVCEGLAPDVFQIDDDDYLQILDDRVTDENRARIDQAIAACPKAALSLVEDEA